MQQKIIYRTVLACACMLLSLSGFCQWEIQEGNHPIFERIKKLNEQEQYQHIVDTLGQWIHNHKTIDSLADEICRAYYEQSCSLQDLKQYQKSNSIIDEGISFLNKNTAAILNPEYHMANFNLTNAWNYFKLFNYSECVERSEIVLGAETYLINTPIVKSRLLNVLGLCAERMDLFSKAIEAHRKAIEIRKNLGKPLLFSLSLSYNNIAIAFQNSGKIDSARFYFLENLKLVLDSTIYVPRQAINSHLNFSHFLRRNNRASEAEKYIKTADSICKAEFSPDHVINSWVDYAFGLLYIDQKNIDKAILSLKNCLAIEKRIYGEKHFALANTYRNLGAAYYYAKDNVAFEKVMNLAVESYELKYEPHHSRIAELYETMVDYFSEDSDLEKVGFYLNEWQNTIIGRETSSRELLKYYSKRAMHYAFLGKDNEALSFLNKAKNAIKEIDAPTNDLFAEFYSAAFHVYHQLERFEEANKYILDYFTKIKYEKYSTNFDEIDFESRIMEFLNLDFMNLQDQEKFEQSLENRQAFLVLLNHVYTTNPDKGYISYSDKIFHRVFEDAMLVNSKFYETSNNELFRKNIFQLFESAKGIKTRSYFQFSSFTSSDVLTQQEYEIQKKIIELERSVIAVSDDENGNMIRNEIIRCKNDLDQMQNEVRVNNPDLYRLKYDLSTIKLSDAQNHLKINNALLLEFHIGENALHTIVVAADTFLYYSTENVDTVNQLVRVLRGQLSNPNSINWEETSSKLYSELFSGLDQFVDFSDFDRLLISPDGMLNHIPFEVLTDNSNLVIEKIPVNYISSMTVFDFKSKGVSNNLVHSSASFAPEYKLTFVNTFDTTQNQYLSMLVRSGNYELKGAQDEASEIAHILGGKLFTGLNAEALDFKENAGRFDLLHLAMHSYTNLEYPEQSGLIFSDPDQREQIVYLHDLRGMKLKAKLAVLSACETGYGKYEKSDGVNSIAQSFAYAGVPSTLMSLWKVPDTQTKLIMMPFYLNLKEGLPKDVALRNTKLSYLDEVKVPALKHPYYWAGFVLQGDPSSLNICSWGWSRPFAYSMILGLGLIVFFFLLFRIIFTGY